MLLLRPELDNSDIVGCQDQTISPKVVKKRRDVSLKLCLVRVCDPGEDMLSVVVRALIEGADPQITSLAVLAPRLQDQSD